MAHRDGWHETFNFQRTFDLDLQQYRVFKHSDPYDPYLMTDRAPGKKKPPKGLDQPSPKPRRKRRPPKIPWKKPKDMPKRPLSAYNLFFQHEREQLILKANQEHGTPMETDEDRKPAAVASSDAASTTTTTTPPSESKSDLEESSSTRRHLRTSGIGFANLAKTIAAKWKGLDPASRSSFEAQAASEKERYQKEMVIWRSKKKKEQEQAAEDTSSKDPSPEKEDSKPAPVPQKKRKKPPNESIPHTRRRSSVPLPSKRSSGSGHALVKRDFSSDNDDNIAYIRQTMSFEKELSPLDSENSSEEWVPPTDGGSLGSSPDFDEETLDVTERPHPHRSYSDSALTHQNRERPEISQIRSCEEIAEDVKNKKEGDAAEAKGDGDSPTTAVVNNSLKDLTSSLDEKTVDFLTNLKFE